MKTLSFAFTYGLLAANAFGTIQAPERFVHEGETVAIDAAPLESLFDKKGSRPEELYAISSACWRGYIGTWTVDNGFLCLQSLIRPKWEFDEETDDVKVLDEVIPLSLIFEAQKSPIKATWFTGVLRCPLGKTLRCRHMEVHEKDIYFTIEKGRVVWELVVDNRREGATQSREDLIWIARGRGLIEDEGEWHDFRLIGTAAFKQIRESGKQFTTRGIFFQSEENELPFLSVWPTPTTEYKRISLRALPKKHKVRDWDHVEITAHFEKSTQGYEIHVDSICTLKLGETMHEPSFQPPKSGSTTLGLNRVQWTVQESSRTLVRNRRGN